MSSITQKDAWPGVSGLWTLLMLAFVAALAVYAWSVGPGRDLLMPGGQLRDPAAGERVGVAELRHGAQRVLEHVRRDLGLGAVERPDYEQIEMPTGSSSEVSEGAAALAAEQDVDAQMPDDIVAEDIEFSEAASALGEAGTDQTDSANGVLKQVGESDAGERAIVADATAPAGDDSTGIEAGSFTTDVAGETESTQVAAVVPAATPPQPTRSRLPARAAPQPPLATEAPSEALALPNPLQTPVSAPSEPNPPPGSRRVEATDLDDGVLVVSGRLRPDPVVRDALDDASLLGKVPAPGSALVSVTDIVIDEAPEIEPTDFAERPLIEEGEVQNTAVPVLEIPTGASEADLVVANSSDVSASATRPDWLGEGEAGSVPGLATAPGALSREAPRRARPKPAVSNTPQAVLSTRGMSMEQQRAMAALVRLSGQLKFDGVELGEGSAESAYRIYETLFLYAESPVLLRVASRDGADEAANLDISTERAGALLEYFSEHGLDEKLFRVEALGSEGVGAGAYRVEIVMLPPARG